MHSIIGNGCFPEASIVRRCWTICRRRLACSDLLCTIFGNSDALAFTLIRDPMLIHWLADNGLSKPPSRAGMESILQQHLDGVSVTELKLDALRRFRRREMLRIGVRDLFRLAPVEETTASLSDLASVLIHAAYRIVNADLRLQYGVPMHRGRDGKLIETGFSVIGMGKLGGHELNYSSDVDLIYVYESSDGEIRHGTHSRRGRAPAVPAWDLFRAKNILNYSPGD